MQHWHYYAFLFLTVYFTPPLEGYHVDDTVPFYVFDTAVLRDSSWEAIKRDSLWLACYEMSVEAVVANDYQLCYTD